jgi:hypothetical protein
VKVLLAVTPVTGHVTPMLTEVAARIGWSGVGIDLATRAPTQAVLRGAIERVLTEPGFRQRALALSAAIVGMDTRRAIVRAIDAIVDGRGRAESRSQAMPRRRASAAGAR